jgi:large subunit ribosomal protein L25
MATSAQIPALAENLPQRLINFFARYPPQLHSAAVRRPAVRPKGEALPQTPLPSPYTPDREAKGAQGLKKDAWTPSRALLVTSETVRNPFLPHKRLGKWEAPKFGLRQQADLMKLAIKYNVETLLPPSRKSPEFKETRREERGLQVKGTGIGQKVKGHKWERTMESRLEDRRKAMEGMPELVRTWKQVSVHLVLPVTSLTRHNREVMAVDGNNGPSGNRTVPLQQVTASFSLFWPVCSFRLFSALLALARTASTSLHVRATQQELGMEFYIRSILSTQSVQYNLRSRSPMLAARNLCIYFWSLSFTPDRREIHQQLSIFNPESHGHSRADTQNSQCIKVDRGNQGV